MTDDRSPRLRTRPSIEEREGLVTMNDDAVLRGILDPHDPADAGAAYYAWWHPGSRVHTLRLGEHTGVFIEATSEFGPVGLVRASDPAVVPALAGVIPPGRRYLMAPWTLAGALEEVLRIEEGERNSVFSLDRRDFMPAPLEGTSLRQEDATTLATVDGQVAARCRLLWRSPEFAELAVATEPRFQRRGLGRAVLSATISRLFDDGVTPLHIAARTNSSSIRLAKGLGFTRCPSDEFGGYVVVESPEVD